MEKTLHTNKFLIIFTFLFLNTVIVPAQEKSGKLSGKVTDQVTGEPLIGASVLILGTGQGVATDLEGNYRLTLLPLGPTKIKISYLGYQSVEQEITIQATTTWNVTLQVDSKVMDEVVVTAQALGQAGAINQQLNSSTILNVVSKDRIRELPDQNAAETVGRISGIYVQRDAGEGQKVVVRGLAPRFNNVTVNGLRIPSTDPNDRSVDLSMISPDMLSGIEVYKALRPDQDGDAIGGAVNFQVKKASEDPEVFATMQYGYNGLDRELGQYKGTLNLSNRYLNEKLGIVLTGNYQRANRSSDQLRAEYNFIEQDAFGASLIEPAELVLADIKEVRKRYGGSLVLDYKFNNGGISWSNLYGRTDRDEVRRRRRYRWSEQRQEFDIRDRVGITDVISSALNGEHKLFDKIDFTWQGSFSQSTQNNPDVVETRFREISAFASEGVNLINQSADSTINLANNDLSETWMNLISIDSDKIVEQAITLQADFKLPYKLAPQIPGFIKMGVKYRDNQRERERERIVGNYFSATSGELHEFLLQFPNLYPRVPSNGGIAISAFLNGPTSSNFLNGDYFMGPGTGETNGPGLNANALSTLANNLNTAGFLSKDYLADIDDNRSTEKVYATYIMTEFEVARKLLVLAGLRFERTQTSYRGNFMTTGVDYDDGGAFESVVKDSIGERNYNEFLPMLHLRYRANTWMDIRAAATRTLSRPDFGNLIPFRRINDNEQTIQQANPELLQIQAWNYDLSFSMYNKNGLLTIGGFYKRLTNVDYQRTFTRLLPVNDPYRGYTITSPENSTGTTTVFGSEIDLQANFRFLPKPFNGFIVSANLTLLNSETFYPFIPDPLRLPTRPFTAFPDLDEFRSGRAPRQANLISNISIGYEVKGFSGRVSLVYQGDTFTALGTRSSLDSYQLGNTRVDLAAKQRIHKNWKLFLNCNNLTNAAEISFIGDSDRRTAEDYYGFTADIGIQYQWQK
jgi:TonB-dependent receptor